MVMKMYSMRPRTGHAQRGFTFIEVLVTSAMIGILALFIPRFFAQINKSAMNVADETTMLQNTTVTQYMITKFLQSARSSTIQISQLPNNPPFSMVQFTSISGDQIQIAQSGADLVMVKNGVKSKLVQSGIKAISFILPNPNDLQLVQYGMTIQNQQGTLSYSFGAKSVRLDNI